MFKTVMMMFSVVLAFATANPISFWGSGLTAPSASSWTSPLSWEIASQPASLSTARLGPAAPIGIYNYRGPLSLAPGQPANILAADGRPLDTLSVNLDRAVHNTARALEGRRLQKRSLVAANLAGAHFAAGPLASGHVAATSFVAAPLTLGRSWVGPAPLAPVALGVGGRVGNIW